MHLLRRWWAWLSGDTPAKRREKDSLGRLLYPPRRGWLDHQGKVWDR
jgi:hypothetical protein